MLHNASLSPTDMSVQQCSRLPTYLLPGTRPTALHHSQNRSSSRIQCTSTSDKAGKALSSLDKLLGSKDEEDTKAKKPAPQTIRKLSTSQTAPARKLSSTTDQNTRFIGAGLPSDNVKVGVKTEFGEAVQPPRVQPYFSYLFYYGCLLVFGGYVEADMVDGLDEAEDFVSLLANDHMAAASGQMWRFITSSFVHDKPEQLFVTLLALATVSVEVEAIIGYAPYLVALGVSAAAGSLAEAITGDLQITYGSSAALAGLVGVYAVHLIKNYNLELKIAAASSSAGDYDIPSDNSRFGSRSGSSMSSMGSGGSIGSIDDGTGEDSQLSDAEAERRQRVIQQRKRAIAQREYEAKQERVEAEIEMPLPINLPFPMPKVKGMVTPQQRAIISVAAATLAGFQALLDIADRDGHATTIGVVAGLLAGAALGFGLAPQYDIRREVDIPEGSMMIPENAREMLIVVDTTSVWRRLAFSIGGSGAVIAGSLAWKHAMLY